MTAVDPVPPVEPLATAVAAPAPAEPAADDPSPGDDARVATSRRDRVTRPLQFGREVALVAVFYAGYTFVRNRFGSSTVSAEHAFDNAERIIRFEQWLGIFHEQTIQSWFLGWHDVLVFWNTFYGTLHFAVTIGTLVWLFVRFPADYPRLRNVLAFTTGLALLGFSVFPLMPPRLLCDCAYGGGAASASCGFVDTPARDGGPWSFGSSAMKAVSNQWAAMPSVHFAWALWVALALYPRVRRRWVRGLVIAYPPLTVVAVLVTANHFLLDVVGGAAIVGVGWAAGTAFTRWRERVKGIEMTTDAKNSAGSWSESAARAYRD